MSEHVLAFGIPGGVEWIVIVLIALLLFGRRLPDVARSVGKSIIEFKKGMKDVRDNIDEAASLDSEPKRRIENKPDTTGGASNQDAPKPKVSEESESTTPR